MRLNRADSMPSAAELIAGYWIWQVKSVEEAVEWIKRAPFAKSFARLLQQTEAK